MLHHSRDIARLKTFDVRMSELAGSSLIISVMC